MEIAILQVKAGCDLNGGIRLGGIEQAQGKDGCIFSFQHVGQKLDPRNLAIAGNGGKFPSRGGAG